MQSPFVKCRGCGNQKGRTDICPCCQARAPRTEFQASRGQAISLTSKHFFHAPASTLTKVSRGDYR